MTEEVLKKLAIRKLQLELSVDVIAPMLSDVTEQMAIAVLDHTKSEVLVEFTSCLKTEFEVLVRIQPKGMKPEDFEMIGRTEKRV